MRFLLTGRTSRGIIETVTARGIPGHEITVLSLQSEDAALAVIEPLIDVQGAKALPAAGIKSLESRCDLQ